MIAPKRASSPPLPPFWEKLGPILGTASGLFPTRPLSFLGRLVQGENEFELITA